LIVESYELISNKAQKNRLLGVFHIKNISQQPIDKAQFTFISESNFKVAPHPTRQATDPIPLDAPVPPSTSTPIKIPFQYETYTQPQTLGGKFNYDPEGQIEFLLAFPCSASIINEDIDKTNLFNILRTEATESQTVSLLVPLQKATSRISGLFRVKVVEQEADKVSMYGKTVQDHHVAFLVKVDGDGPAILVNIKSNDATLVVSLSKELQDLTW